MDDLSLILPASGEKRTNTSDRDFLSSEDRSAWFDRVLGRLILVKEQERNVYGGLKLVYERELEGLEVGGV